MSVEIKLSNKEKVLFLRNILQKSKLPKSDENRINWQKDLERDYALKSKGTIWYSVIRINHERQWTLEIYTGRYGGKYFNLYSPRNTNFRAEGDRIFTITDKNSIFSTAFDKVSKYLNELLEFVGKEEKEKKVSTKEQERLIKLNKKDEVIRDILTNDFHL